MSSSLFDLYVEISVNKLSAFPDILTISFSVSKKLTCEELFVVGANSV